MNAFLLLFSNRDKALGEAKALRDSDGDWNVVVTGPNDGVEVLEGNDPLADSTKSWAVFASKRPLLEPPPQ